MERALADGAEDVQPVVRADPSRPPIRERLSAEDICQIVRRFRDGTAKRVLAAEYDISLSSVKRLIRKNRTSYVAAP